MVSHVPPSKNQNMKILEEQGREKKSPHAKKYPPTFTFLVVGGKDEAQIVCAALPPVYR